MRQYRQRKRNRCKLYKEDAYYHQTQTQRYLYQDSLLHHCNLETKINYYKNFLIYCSGEGCSLSEDLGFYLNEQFGIEKIFIYEGGMPEWIKFGYPLK